MPDNLNNTLERDLTGLKVVVVDDSKTILRTAEVLLSEQGCWVVTAGDGFESLAKISSFKPDVIFVDIMMPRLDGYQTCALIKANRQYRDTPVILLSSKDSIFDMARGRLAGSDKYLTKPFTKEDLLTAIYTHVKLPKRAGTVDANVLDAPTPAESTPFIDLIDD
ncbi:response regulator [Thiothrix litoralis]|uniref:Response regulator n=1 Tax=Thiothrix litoralis TaxID=2891210 RepID=A0ABX7WN18_9GAMM|nr:response regulator [Thiothrix litoralis]QTR45161.1 response regulator [Thiothrix litoralis]